MRCFLNWSVKMVKNYIFDFGRVLVHFDLDYMTSAYIKNKSDCDLAKNIIFDRLYWDKLDAGTITDSEVLDGIFARLPEYLHNDAEKVYLNWYHNLPVIDGMRELLAEIKSKGARLYLLSNISIGFADNYINVPEIKFLLEPFDGLVFSGKIGLTKPKKEIFEHLLSKYSLKAEECAFIDDSPINIKGAESIGIKGYLFNGDAKDLKTNLFG